MLCSRRSKVKKKTTRRLRSLLDFYRKKSITTVLNEYTEIREDLIRQNPQLTPENLTRLSQVAFEDKYQIPYHKATDLEEDGQWTRWLDKHKGDTECCIVQSSQIKALKQDEHGRFVEFDLITSDIDQSAQSKNLNKFNQEYDDLITPDAIKDVEKQLKGSIVNMYDPSKVTDFSQALSDGAKFGGIGHEHVVTNPDIVPALIIDEVKAINNNTRLRVTARVNEKSQRADDVWDMIEDGTLKGASIEYKALDKSYKTIGERIVRVIDKLALTGFTLTSKMRNAACGITGVFVKALPESPSSLSNEDNITQENKMADDENVPKPDEEKKEEAPVDNAAPEETKEEASLEAQPSDEVKALKEELAEMKTKLDELKALEEDKKLIEGVKPFIKEEIKAALEPEIKSLVEENQEKFEKVKSAKEEIKAAKESGVDAMWKTAAAKHNELVAAGCM